MAISNEPVRQVQVYEQLGLLRSLIDDVDTTAANLLDRTQKVRFDLPSVNAREGATPEEPLCLLAVDIRQLRYNLYPIYERLNYILGHLEI